MNENEARWEYKVYLYRAKEAWDGTLERSINFWAELGWRFVTTEEVKRGYFIVVFERLRASKS